MKRQNRKKKLDLKLMDETERANAIRLEGKNDRSANGDKKRLQSHFVSDKNRIKRKSFHFIHHNMTTNRIYKVLGQLVFAMDSVLAIERGIGMDVFPMLLKSPSEQKCNNDQLQKGISNHHIYSVYLSSVLLNYEYLISPSQ